MLQSCPSSDATPPAVLPTLVPSCENLKSADLANANMDSQKLDATEGHLISTLRNLTRILIRILMLLLGELLVLLILIELLTNQGLETGVQGMPTAAKITKSEKRQYRICKLS